MTDLVEKARHLPRAYLSGYRSSRSGLTFDDVGPIVIHHRSSVAFAVHPDQ